MSSQVYDPHEKGETQMTTKSTATPRTITSRNPRYAGATPEQIARALLRNRKSVKKKSTRQPKRDRGKFQSSI